MTPGWYPTDGGLTRFWDGHQWTDRPFPGSTPAVAPEHPIEAPTRAPAKSRWEALRRSGLHRYLVGLAVIVIGALTWLVIANTHDGPSTAAGTRAGEGYAQVFKAASGQTPDMSGLRLQCDLMAGTTQSFGNDSLGIAPGALDKDDFIDACVQAASRR